MAKITVFVFFILTCTLCSFAQEVTNDEDIFILVEQKPEFPGGERERVMFMGNNLTYPEVARRNGIAGTVYVTFVIEKTGKVSNVKILRGIGGGCEEEVVRIVEAMPYWIPGKQGGKPVRVQYTMPVKFNLATEEEIYGNSNTYVADTTYNPEEIVYTDVEEAPEFPGGEEQRIKFLVKNINYPERARSNNTYGTVYVTYIIEKSGQVSNIRIVQGIGDGCDEEVVRLIKAMPRWTPGKHKGEVVRVQYTMPVKFML